MPLTFAAITETGIAELSSGDIALVSGGGWEWGIQDPNSTGSAAADPGATDSWDWC